ncbi:hypothetical protein Tco_0019316 [Tanacetum coccineum]
MPVSFPTFDLKDISLMEKSRDSYVDDRSKLLKEDIFPSIQRLSKAWIAVRCKFWFLAGLVLSALLLFLVLSLRSPPWSRSMIYILSFKKRKIKLVRKNYWEEKERSSNSGVCDLFITAGLLALI